MNKNNFGSEETKQSGTSSTGTSGTSSTGVSGSTSGGSSASSSGFERHAMGSEGNKRNKAESQQRRGSTQNEEAGDEEQMSIANLKEVGRNLGEQLERQMQERPYVVLGAVAGVGFVAGSLLGSRLGQIAVALAGGYLVRNVFMKEGGVQKFVKEGIDKLGQESRARG